MLIFSAPASINGAGLASELAAAGYQQPEFVLNGDNVEVSALTSAGNPIDERSRDSIQAVIDAHTGQSTEEQQRTATLRTRADSALTDLRTIRDSSGNLSSAQLSNAVRLLARVLIVLVRLALSRYDGVD